MSVKQRPPGGSGGLFFCSEFCVLSSEFWVLCFDPNNVLYSLFFILYFYSIISMIINSYLVTRVYKVSPVALVSYEGISPGLSIRLMPAWRLPADRLFIFWLLFDIYSCSIRRNFFRVVSLFKVLYSLFFILYFYSIISMIINSNFVSRVYKVSPVALVSYEGISLRLSIRLMPAWRLPADRFFISWLLFDIYSCSLRRNFFRVVSLFKVLYSLFFIQYFYSICFHHY